jgi:hypothetical protein
MEKAKGGVPMSDWSGSGATDRLHQTIKDFNEKATKQTEQLIWLTRALVFLTVVLIVGLVIQLLVALEIIGGG